MTQATDLDFKAAIEKATAGVEKASNAKDAATVASYYTENATLLPPGSGPIKGRADIQAFWQRLYDAGSSNVKLRPVDIGSSGDIAYEIGAFEANMPNAQGGTAPASGKYLVVWNRQSDGSIKIVADMFSTNA